MYYSLILESDNWQVLNWLYNTINNESDYRATAREYLNVGESMISKLEIYYFKSGEFAKTFIKALYGYHYGTDLEQIGVRFRIEEETL